MPDQVLEILIKMQADMAALKQSTAGLDELKEKVKQGGGAHEEATRSVLKHGGAHRELHKLMHAVSHQSPILGLALRAAFSPLGAVIMTGVVALQYFHHWLEEAKKKADELDKTSAATWEAQRKGAQDASKVAEDWAQHLKEVAQSHDVITEKYERDKTLLNEIIKAHKELLEAMEKEELANAQKAGDKEQEETIKKRFELLKKTSELAGEEQQHQLKIGQLQTEKTTAAKAEDQAAIARQALAEAKGSATSVAQAKSEMGAKPLETLLKEQREAEKFYSGIQRYNENAPQQMRDPGAEEVAKKRYEVAKQAVDHYKQNAELVEQYNHELEKLNKAAEKANAEYEKHANAVRKLTQEIETEGKVIGIHRSTAFQTDKLPKAADAYSFAADAAHKLAGGGKLSPQEDAILRSIGSVIAGQNVSAAMAAKMIIAAEGNQERTNQFLEKVLRVMESTQNAFKPFERRLDDLERQIQSARGNISH